MDAYGGRARLEWWANATTCLGSVDVDVEIRVVEGDWVAQAGLVRPVDDDVEEGFRLLHQMDPVFTLCFPDESTIEVIVGDLSSLDSFQLTEST